MSHAIEIMGLTKGFGAKRAVEALDLSIERGQLVGFIGPNGAGKTTTIRMVMSILFPDSGTLRVLGKGSAIESKDRIGYLPEERGVYKKMRVAKFLRFMARLKGVPEQGLDARIERWLDRVALSDCARKKCEELSKGMQQKVQFVAAVIHEPELIILDEPFSGLDPVNARLLRELIHEQHRAGRTIIFSTHQMSQAEAICDRVVMIHQGRKVLDDTPRAIRSRFTPRSVLVEPVDAGLARPALEGMEGVAGVEAVNGAMVASLAPGVEAPAVIARIASAIPVTRVEAVRPTLEDVFIEIVQGEGADAQEREKLLASLRVEGAGGSAGD